MFMVTNTRALPRAGLLGLLLMALGGLTVSPPAEAVPAFARQMGVACNTCHYQHFPTPAITSIFRFSTVSGGPSRQADTP